MTHNEGETVLDHFDFSSVKYATGNKDSINYNTSMTPESEAGSQGADGAKNTVRQDQANHGNTLKKFAIEETAANPETNKDVDMRVDVGSSPTRGKETSPLEPRLLRDSVETKPTNLPTFVGYSASASNADTDMHKNLHADITSSPAAETGVFARGTTVVRPGGSTKTSPDNSNTAPDACTFDVDMHMGRSPSEMADASSKEMGDELSDFSTEMTPEKTPTSTRPPASSRYVPQSASSYNTAVEEFSDDDDGSMSMDMDIDTEDEVNLAETSLAGSQTPTPAPKRVCMPPKSTYAKSPIQAKSTKNVFTAVERQQQGGYSFQPPTASSDWSWGAPAIRSRPAPPAAPFAMSRPQYSGDPTFQSPTQSSSFYAGSQFLPGSYGSSPIGEVTATPAGYDVSRRGRGGRGNRNGSSGGGERQTRYSQNNQSGGNRARNSFDNRNVTPLGRTPSVIGRTLSNFPSHFSRRKPPLL